MGAPSYLWNETAAMNSLKEFLVACCPEVDKKRIFRINPGAVPSASNSALITIAPINGGPPILLSYMGEESVVAQIQVVQVVITAAAEGVWTLILLESEAIYAAGPGETTTEVRDGIKAAVIALALPITVANVEVTGAPGFSITADVAGVSMRPMFLDGDIPDPGAAVVLMIDDNLRRTSYNWGEWTVRLVFRDTPSSEQGPSNRVLASTLCDRVRCWLQAGNSLPVINGSAYPYVWDQLGQLAWKETMTPIEASALENGIWTRAVAMDVVFEVAWGMSADIPSLDEIGEGSLTLTA